MNAPAHQGPIAWLLLRDQHAIPISSLEPEALKSARKNAHEYSASDLSHVQGLNAIIDRLGFDGDFGDYKHHHFPEISGNLEASGAHRRADLFSVRAEHATIGFKTFIAKPRRKLADRLFESDRPFPKRVFLPNHYYWEDWPDVAREKTTEGDLEFEPTNLEEARKFVSHRRRYVEFNFRKDQLFDLGDEHDETVAVDLYLPKNSGGNSSYSEKDFERDVARYRQVTEIFRQIINRQNDGWFDVVPLTESLAAIVGQDGSYDLVWRHLREEPPPSNDSPQFTSIDARSTFDLAVREQLYFIEGSFEELTHRSEKRFYEGGGTMGAYPGSKELLRRLLEEQEPTNSKRKTWPEQKPTPPRFRRIEFQDGHETLVSTLIDVEAFYQKARATKYWERRDGEDWDAANKENSFSEPVVVNALDAFAYLSWLEESLDVRVRLLTAEEHRELRPFPSLHYAQMKNCDFPWERNPPRRNLASALNWSEPRFHEEAPETSQEVHTTGRPSRKRWIEDFPPSVQWRTPLKWEEYRGLKFLDAWDVAEWIGPVPGRCAGRYWEGPLAKDSWGAYKNLVTTFRVVIDVGPDPEGG